jgi:hypothetical protein
VRARLSPLFLIETFCPLLNDGVATWTATTANTSTVAGTCNPGYDVVPGPLNPTRNCYINATWGGVTNPCIGPLFSCPRGCHAPMRDRRLMCAGRGVSAHVRQRDCCERRLCQG